jgi:thioredoxin reductase
VTGATEDLDVEGGLCLHRLAAQTRISAVDLVELDDQGRVRINELMETSVPGLYAAGDLCVRPIYQLANVVADGVQAAVSVEKYLDQK